MDNLIGIIRESKYLFDKKEGFCLYIDVKINDNQGFAKIYNKKKEIREMLVKAGEKSWCWMNPELLIGKEVMYDYDPKTNKCNVLGIKFG